MKKYLRDFYSKIRNSITEKEKAEFDKSVFTRFVNSDFYKNYEGFLVYVSVKSEVGTMDLIRFMLADNKKVAVPYCDNDTMSFYYINSLDNLITGKFGIPSVDITVCNKVQNFDGFLCIVPGLSFDNNGNRLGYGGGYYDRFLSVNKIPSVGLCYERCVCDKIPCESFDIKIDYLLTEQYLRNHTLFKNGQIICCENKV